MIDTKRIGGTMFLYAQQFIPMLDTSTTKHTIVKFPLQKQVPLTIGKNDHLQELLVVHSLIKKKDMHTKSLNSLSIKSIT